MGRLWQLSPARKLKNNKPELSVISYHQLTTKRIKTMIIEITNPEKVILDEMKMRGITQKSIALTYSFCIKQIKDETRFGVINQAIIDRFGEKALERIKKAA